MPVVKLTPHVTEKSLALAKAGKYTFLLSMNANSQTIGERVRRLYNVHPQEVSLVKTAAKMKGSGLARRPGGTRRARPARVKAIVTLKKGEKIADFATEEKK